MKGVSNLTIRITADRRTYALSFLDITGVEAREFRGWTGQGPLEVLQAGSVDLDSLCAFLTLARRKGGERQLSYQQVASQTTWNTIDDIQVSSEDGQQPEPDPTRPGSSS
ncbi:MAG: hypothetical protein M3O70_08245 [Actinomycetota bacterium]|nr:hypothetical protein [Actinomycetota bacterium]